VPRHTKFVSKKFDVYESSSMIVTAVGRPTGSVAFGLASPRITYPAAPAGQDCLAQRHWKNP
jgi:hypothetical protein